MESPKKDNDFVKKIISSPEGKNLDFKQSITSQSKIAKTMVAFANTEGGRIIVGVSDNRQLIGIDPEEEKFMINEAITKYCVPPLMVSFEVYEIDYWQDRILDEEKHLLIVNIPKSNDQPHFVSDNQGTFTYYVRKNDRSLPEDYAQL